MKTDLLTMSFSASPFSVAMSTIAAAVDAPIVWSRDCDELTVSATFNGVPVEDVLNCIARRAGVRLTRLGAVYYLGETVKTDTVFAVVRCPAVDSQQLQAALGPALGEYGTISIVGSCIMLSDTIDRVRLILDAVEALRIRSESAYIVEVFFLRMRNSALLALQADFEAQGVNLLSSGWKLEDVLSCSLSFDGDSTAASFNNRPVLYLSEGRPSELTIGSDITLERKSVSNEGTATTSGYDTFSDGVRLSLTLLRLRSEIYSITFDLEVSQFGSTSDGSTVPRKDKSEIKSPALIVRDGGVFFVGSLSSKKAVNGRSLLGFSKDTTDEIVTVWVRARQLKLD